MTFNQLLQLHNHELVITLANGASYEGIITSHYFLDERRERIKQIKLCNDKSIVKIQCVDIRKIEVKKIK
jgi:hypothetical protein